FIYTWHYVPCDAHGILPGLLEDRIQKRLATVNVNPFDPKGINAPKETVLFTGVRKRLKIDVRNQFYANLDYHFLYPYQTHNKFARKDPASPPTKGVIFDYATHDGNATGDKVYPLTDLNGLFNAVGPLGVYVGD